MNNSRFLRVFLPTVVTDVAVTGEAIVTTDATAVPGVNLRVNSDVHMQTSQAYALVKKERVLNGGLFRLSTNSAAVAQVTRPAPQQSPDCTFFFPYNRWVYPRGHQTITASSEVATFPATNTQKQKRSKIWRSTSRTAYLQGDFGNPYRINSVAVVSHNLTSTGTFRVRVGNSASMATTLYDSGTLRIWEPAFATDGVMSEFADSSGYPTDETIEFLRYCSERPRAVRWIVFPEVAARYVRVDFADPDNDDNFIEVAYIYAGLCIRVSPDQLYGWQIWPQGVSRVDRASSGEFWIDNLYRNNRAVANYSAQPELTVLSFWKFASDFLGKKREFIVSFQPDNLPRKFWYSMYAHFVNVPELENHAARRGRLQMEVEELP